MAQDGNENIKINSLFPSTEENEKGFESLMKYFFST